MWNLFSLLAFDNLTPMNMDVILPALDFLWKGLLAIFVVIGLIIITVKLTSLAIAKIEQIKKTREEAIAARQNSETDDANEN